MPPVVQNLTFGEVNQEGNAWIVDAHSHVMMRARRVFTNAFNDVKGKHTHATLRLPISAQNAKDLVWFIERYPLSVAPDAQTKLFGLAEAYDRRIAAAAQGDKNRLLELSAVAIRMAEPAREHQVGFRNLAESVERILLADQLGLGKTISAIACLCEPDWRPALIVVPTHLTTQWQAQLKRFLPDASAHIIRGRKLYQLPPADVLITAYTRLQAWQDILVPLAPRTVIFDEIQDLRKVDTIKRVTARALSEAAAHAIGLSATPIYNYGEEIWSVLDVLYPGALGPRDNFVSEWCSFGQVRDTLALHSFLISQGFMLRRTREDLGLPPSGVQRDVITLEGDIHTLKEIEHVAKTLAMSVLRNEVGVSDGAARELDWKLREATGVAKAKAVAEFVKLLAESGEKVFLVGWHREVYDIWLHALKDLYPVMYTGTESPAQKAASVKRFVEGSSKVFICSLRSGAGLDGLQHVCATVVLGELDWSPQVMEQVIGRLDREGQTRQVNAFFLTIDDGADPFMIEVLSLKQSQSDGVVAGIAGRAGVLDDAVRTDRIRQMAESYLASIGEAPPDPEPATGLHAEVVAALRRVVLPTTTEREMQEALWAVLPDLLPDAKVEREFRYGDRGRLDFLVSREEPAQENLFTSPSQEGEVGQRPGEGGFACYPKSIPGEGGLTSRLESAPGEGGFASCPQPRIAIECKIDQTGRSSVYRQVRRYAEEAGITGLVVLAPWSGVSNFSVAGVPVTIVDWAKAALVRK